MSIPTSRISLPALTVDQMIEVDRAMMEDYGISLLQMMENAGRHLAWLAQEKFSGGTVRDKAVIICAGAGGNGGGAMVCARHLHNWGATVAVVLSRAESGYTGVAAQQLAILKRMQIPLYSPDDVPDETAAHILIDGLIGYGLRGAPHGRTAALIRWINAHTAPTLALDVPSGIDATSGEPFSPCVQATATLTLALPKTGLVEKSARAFVGELYLADISVPPELFRRQPLNLNIEPVFDAGEVVKLNVVHMQEG